MAHTWLHWGYTLASLPCSILVWSIILSHLILWLGMRLKFLLIDSSILFLFLNHLLNSLLVFKIFIQMFSWHYWTSATNLGFPVFKHPLLGHLLHSLAHVLPLEMCPSDWADVPIFIDGWPQNNSLLENVSHLILIHICLILQIIIIIKCSNLNIKIVNIIY